MSAIIHKAPHSNTNVYIYQADLFLMLTYELFAAYEKDREIELNDWFELPEYKRFVKGAYACGFVCNNFSLMKNFSDYINNPDEYLKNACWTEFRHFIHTLLRGEKWSDGYSSPILDAARSGVLSVVIRRLEHVETLIDPEILVDDCD